MAFAWGLWKANLRDEGLAEEERRTSNFEQTKDTRNHQILPSPFLKCIMHPMIAIDKRTYESTMPPRNRTKSAQSSQCINETRTTMRNDIILLQKRTPSHNNEKVHNLKPQVDVEPGANIYYELHAERAGFSMRLCSKVLSGFRFVLQKIRTGNINTGRPDCLIMFQCMQRRTHIQCSCTNSWLICKHCKRL